ncbi:MAG: sugar ABC transporter ATP-binding protein, partial [Mesorhizobium sp.]
LIFDEPTAALTEREAQKLFEIIHQLAGEGIGIIYISHRMAEIFDNCDRVTVLRDGRYITTLDIAGTTPEQVVASMVGRVIDSLYPEKLRDDERSEDILLEIVGLCEATAFRDISFQLRKGEI